MMAMASRRRSAIVTPSTRTAIGSRPKQAFMQDFDGSTLDEAKLNQTALKILDGPVGPIAGMIGPVGRLNCADATFESQLDGTQRARG